MIRTSEEVAKILGISARSVTSRANKLKIKKKTRFWLFTDDDLVKLKNYEPIYSEKIPLFWFSDDGNFLIIPSLMNKKL